VRSQASDVSETSSGVLLGGGASLELWRASLDLLYWQGGVTAGGTGAERDVVEGEAMLGFRILGWLSFKLGPHARTYITTEETHTRWLFWEMRVAADAALGTPLLSGYFEGWTSLSANLGVAEALDRAQGLQGGLRFEPRSTPIFVTIGYRMDHSRLASGTRLETIEHLLVALGWRFGGR